MSPRNRNVGYQPQKLILIRIRVMGWVLVSTLLQHVTAMVVRVPGLEVFWAWTSLSEARRPQGWQVHLYPCSLPSPPSMTTSESCWRGLLSTMETSLALSPSNNGGGEPESGLPFILESCLCCSSSFCTLSSQDMEEDWLSSMASLKAVCWGVRFFHHFIPRGLRGCGQFFDPRGLMGHRETHLSMFRMSLSLYYGSAILPHPVFSWIHYETDLLVLLSWVFICPTPRFSCWDHRRGLWWSPEAIWVCLCSSCQHLLFSY